MTSTARILAAAAAVLALGSLAGVCTAQEYQEYADAYSAPPVAAEEPTALLSADQLDELLAPVALYPDSLLAQVLPAATYPLDVIKAQQWLAAHPEASDELIDVQPWDPSVQAVAHYPTVLAMLAEHIDWTQALGAAFLYQQQDVMDAIQRLRQEAIDAGNLQTTAEQEVVVADDAVQILPASPEVIYVPQYDPQVVYVRRVYAGGPPVITFVRRLIGRWLDFGFDWHRRHVTVGVGWHSGWHYVDRRWRPVARNVTVIRTGPVVRYSGVVTSAPLLTRSWSRNNLKPRPLLPRPVVVRHDAPRVEARPRGPAAVKPFSVPRPVVRTIPTRPPAAAVTPGPLRVEPRRDVENAARRGSESRSSWTGRGGTRTPPPTVTRTAPPTVTRIPPTATPTVTKPPTVTRTPPTVTRTPPTATPTVTKPPTVTRTPPTVTHTPPTVTRTPTATSTPRSVPGTTARPAPSAFGVGSSSRDVDAASRRGQRSLRDGQTGTDSGRRDARQRDDKRDRSRP